MPGVEDVRAGIARSNDKARDSIASLAQATHALEEAQQMLAQATAGSTQDEINQVYGMYSEAIQSLGGLQGTIEAGITSNDGYAARL